MKNDSWENLYSWRQNDSFFKIWSALNYFVKFKRISPFISSEEIIHMMHIPVMISVMLITCIKKKFENLKCWTSQFLWCFDANFCWSIILICVTQKLKSDQTFSRQFLLNFFLPSEAQPSRISGRSFADHPFWVFRTMHFDT